MPDEIRPNTVRNVSLQTHNSSLKLSLFRVQSSAQSTQFILGPALCPSYSSLRPKPLLSCPNHTSLMPKTLQSHAQTTPVSFPNHSSLMPKPLQSHTQTTPVSVPNHSSHASINRCHDILVPCEAMNIITCLTDSPALRICHCKSKPRSSSATSG